MREILFKAKSIETGEWVEGYLYIRKDGVAEINYYNKEWDCERYTHEVDSDTICQYTGLTDKKGNKIWENDVISYWDTYSTENGYAEADCIGKVYWDEETLSFQVTERLSAESYEVFEECSVIGNVFDNADLVKE